MIRVTWEWLGQGPALDLADTVTSSDGEATDLLEPPGRYEEWAQAHVDRLGLPAADHRVLVEGRAGVLALRTTVREVMGALAHGRPPPQDAVAALNSVSRAAPEWTELDRERAELVTRTNADPTAALLARYARDALRWAAGEAGPVRRCPAPSCGMFYPPSRPQQRWCSTACGSRARVARHYAATHSRQT